MSAKDVHPLALISTRFSSLSQSEKRVASYVQQHPADVVYLSLQALAQRCEVSDSTVLRFCRSLGYSGYQDFKSALIPHLLREGASIHRRLHGSDTFQQRSSKFISNLTEDLTATISQCDEGVFTNVVNKIANAGQLLVFGLAGSAGVGRIFADSITSIGKAAFPISDRVEMERIAAIVGKDAVVLAISHSGEAPEVCHAVERSKENGAFTVGITNFDPSTLAAVADVTMLTVVPENLLGSYSCQPRIAQLALLEMIVHGVSDKLAETSKQSN